MTSKLIENRPTLWPAEVLEFVPGVIVTRHEDNSQRSRPTTLAYLRVGSRITTT